MMFQGCHKLCFSFRLWLLIWQTDDRFIFFTAFLIDVAITLMRRIFIMFVLTTKFLNDNYGK